MLHAFDQSALSLLPPVLAIVLSIATRRVLLSLGIAILTGALMLNDLHLMATLNYLANNALHLVWDEGLSSWNVSLIGFLLLLGILSTFIARMGGTQAFGRWALKHIRSARGARLFTVFLGFLIFIDDYFSSLAVGQVARPVTDQYRIPRAKLAYLIDSTSAPVCVLSPISSWGAYIMGILTVIMSTQAIPGQSALSLFIALLPFNFYPWLALVLVGVIAYTGWSIGPMHRHVLAAQLGQLFPSDGGEKQPGVEVLNMPADIKGRPSDLIIPIVTLIVSAIALIIAGGIYGAQKAALPLTIFNVLEQTDVGLALLCAAGLSLMVCLYLSLAHRFAVWDYGRVVVSGIKSMLPAIYILLFAWMIIAIINDLKTGQYLAHFINANLPIFLLPCLIFIISGIMAFATGTSWGTFGIMLPIAANIAMGVQPDLILPMLGAVLSGALFGDHASPLSDTTILSATGAGCHLMDHVVTQLPYALLTAGLTALGFITLGLSGSLVLSIILLGVGLVFVFWRVQILYKKIVCLNP